jgi:hypothetical protein
VLRWPRVWLYSRDVLSVHRAAAYSVARATLWVRGFIAGQEAYVISGYLGSD